jgi:hypothetical protein
MCHVEDDLTAQILAGCWRVDAGDGAEAASSHARCHQFLTDFTAFGLALEAFAALHRRDAGDGRFAAIVRALVGRCGMAHEVFAVAFDGWEDDGASPTRAEERAPYDAWGATFVRRAPTEPIGRLALNAVCRIAMNGPLPDSFGSGDPSTLSLEDFDASHDPDRRLVTLAERLDTPFWTRVVALARKRFGSHAHWSTYLDTDPASGAMASSLNLERVGDRVLTGSGGIDKSFENDVCNYFIDQAIFEAAQRGVDTYSLRHRQELDRAVRSRLPSLPPRPYDEPERIGTFGLRRIYEREHVHFRRSALPTSVGTLRSVSEDDWSAYQQILPTEGSLPAYLRAADDVRRNHALDRPLPGDGEPVCFLRKKRWLSDGAVGLDVHVIQEPQRLARLQTIATLAGGDVRVCISGALLVSADPERLAPWVAAAAGMPTTILLDADPSAILARLNDDWAALTWHVQRLAEIDGAQMLFLFPVGDHAPRLCFLRPCTDASADATLQLLPRPAVPLALKLAGVRIGGIPDELLAEEWAFPLHAVWTAKRCLSEERVFAPTPAAASR